MTTSVATRAPVHFGSVRHSGVSRGLDAVILSAALDTNGQNARYVEAARKHGRDRAVLDVLAIGQTDPAGVVSRFAEVGEKYGLRIRSAHRAQPYFNFPVDILWTKHTEPEIRKLAHAADVIHLNNTWRAYVMLRLQGKPALLHHHGSLLRSDPRHMLDTARRYGFIQGVSTIDLTRYAPDELHWLPTAYDLDALAAMKRPTRGRPRTNVRIVHCPTNRGLKATETFIKAVGSLQAKGMAVEVVIVEGKTNAECLAIKATADIVFDQLAFGYGCNAVEAWGMATPVVAGADDWTLDAMEARWGGLPFYLASEADLAKRLAELVEDADLRRKWGAIGRAHVERYHAEAPALTRLAELYAKAVANHGQRMQRAPVDPVTFANPTGRPLFALDNEGKTVRLRFPNGLATFTDPDVIDRLRHIEATRPLWRVTEVRQ